MAITFFGSSVTPADNGTNATTAITITPPASMVVGDLVIVSCRHRGTGGWTVTNEGGQTWAALGANSTTSNVAIQTYWCRFNGTWSTSPIFNNGGGTNTSVIMFVFRPTSSSCIWSVESSTVTNKASATVQTITGITPSNNSNVSFAEWHTADDNTWGTLTGTNWVKTSLSAQYRNTAGQDGSSTFAYQIQTTAASTNNVSQTQLTLGGDATAVRIVNFYENTPPTVTLQIPSDTATGVSLTPTLSFTGTDAESDDVEYQVQINPTNDFLSLIDGTPISLSGAYGLCSDFATKHGQSFTGNGTSVKKAVFYIYKSGSPTGNVYVEIYAHTGTFGTSSIPTGSPLATSNTIEASTLSTSSSLVEFTFSTPFNVVNGTNYFVVVCFSGTASPNYVYVTRLNGSHNGNSANNYTGWVADADDVLFQLYSETPLINATSDAYFTTGHPYASGVQKSYVVQLSLTESTVYYWRARAKDAFGTNTYGAWSSIYSFTTVAGSPTYNESTTLSSAHTIITDFIHELGGSVNLSSANIVTLNNLLDGVGIVSLVSNNVISMLGNLTIEASISTTIDGAIATTGGLDFVNVITLNSEHLISENYELLLNENVNLITENLIPVSATLDLVAVLTLLSDYTFQTLASLIMDGNASLSINETLNVLAGLEFNNDINLSSDNTLTVQVLLTMEQILTLTQNSTASIASQNDAVGNVTLSSANIISLIADLLMSESVNLNSVNLVSILNQIDLAAATVLTTDNLIIIQGGSDFVNSVTLSLDQTLSSSGTIGFDVQINLATNKSISITTQLDAQNVLQLLSDNQISDLANLELQAALQLQSENQLSASGLIEIILNISLASDSVITASSENNMNTSILIQSNNDLLIAGGLEMNENLTLQTDSVFLDNNLAEYLNSTMLSLDGQVLFSLDELGDLVMLLSSLSQMNASEQIEALAQFELQINNDVLFQAAIDVYDQIYLSGEAFTTFEALRIVNEMFQLNLNSQILFSIGDLFQENINLTLNSTISFIDDILSGEYLKNEIFFGRSAITNNLLLKSLICNMLLQNSKTNTIITLTSKIY